MAAAKAAAKACAKKAATEVRQYSIIECSGTLFTDAKVMTSEFFLNNPVAVPAVIEQVAVDVPESLLGSRTEFVSHDFKASKAYTGSGRGAKMMDGSDGNDSNLLLGHFARKTGIQVLQKVERNEKAYIESPCFVLHILQP